jgi:hypothetical protein
MRADTDVVERASHPGQRHAADRRDGDERAELVDLAGLRSRDTEADLLHEEPREGRIDPIERPGVSDEAPYRVVRRVRGAQRQDEREEFTSAGDTPNTCLSRG